MPDEPSSPIRLALPKGRMYQGVVDLLAQAGISLRAGAREYRPCLSLPNFEVKLLKPHNIVEMLQLGSRDIGFAGADWAAELEVDVVELLDTGLDPVRLVAAAPHDLLVDGALPQRSLVIASEYERLTKGWMQKRGNGDVFVRSYGATEVFPPEDADCIVDNTATGSTLEANGLHIVDELMRSSTRLFAHPRAMEDAERRSRIEDFVLIMQSVLEARRRVLVEINVSAQDLEGLVAVLPCMREPTISPLHGQAGYAVKAAVRREQLPSLIPLLKARGGTDVLVTQPAQIMP
ncbi:MAG: ATP phosphoribosyltransferase [Myxococcota bacterium]